MGPAMSKSASAGQGVGRKVTWLLLHFIPRAKGGGRGHKGFDAWAAGACLHSLGRLSLEKGALSF